MTLKSKLRAGLEKRAQYVIYDDEEEERPWWQDTLIGAGLGAGAGAGVAGVGGAIQGRRRFGEVAQNVVSQLSDPSTLAMYQNPIDPATGQLNPHVQRLERQLADAGGSPSGAMLQGAWSAVPRGALWGAGIGAGIGGLRAVLARVLQRNRQRRAYR